MERKEQRIGNDQSQWRAQKSSAVLQMYGRPRRSECSDQNSFWKHEKCLSFPFCSAACKGTSVRGKRHLRKRHQSHRIVDSFCLWELPVHHKGEKYNLDGLFHPTSCAFCQELLKSIARQRWGHCSSMSTGPSRSEIGHMFPIDLCLAVWNNTVRQNQHSHEHRKHQWPHSIL